MGSEGLQEYRAETAQVANYKCIDEDDMVDSLRICIEYVKGKAADDSMSLEIDMETLIEGCRILSKDRHTTWDAERKLISEHNTWYENISGKEVKYTFTSAFEEHQCVTVGKEKGFTISGQANIGATVFCADASLSSNVGYGIKQLKSQEDGTRKIREQMVEVPVDPKSIVCVKQLVYEVQYKQKCVVQIAFKEMNYRFIPKNKQEESSSTQHVRWEILKEAEVKAKKDEVEKKAKKTEVLVKRTGREVEEKEEKVKKYNTTKLQRKVDVQKAKLEGKKDEMKSLENIKQAFSLFQDDGDRTTLTFKATCTIKTQECQLHTETRKISQDRLDKLKAGH